MKHFWKNKRVLVTGADGFIGSHLTERLAKEGAIVRAFIFYNSFGRQGWLDEIRSDLTENIEIFSGDIRDSNRVLEAVKDQEIVFHLASLIAIPYSYHAPDSYVQTNIGGTLNVLNACRRSKSERLVHTSTSEVYGTAQYIPIDEKHPLQGQSPYSASKIGADMLTESFYRSFDLPVATVRPFNTYGPRQSARAIIPTIISQLLGEASTIKLGALTPIRDFNYVVDTVSGFLAVAEAEAAMGKVVNIGSGRGISIRDLVELIFKMTGRTAEVICEEVRMRPEKSEVDRLQCSNELARKLTGWQPEYTLEQGLEKTAAWIRDNLKSFQTNRYAI